MRTRHLLAAFAVLAAALGVLSSPAAAQTTCVLAGSGQYPPTAPTLQVSQTDVLPGGVLRVTGTCCPANTTVTLTFTPGPVPLGTTQTDANGSFAANIAIPPTASPGTGTITATATGCTVSATVNVLGASVERPPGGALPRTGGVGTIPFSIAGLALVVSGAMAVAAARRKRAAVQ